MKVYSWNEFTQGHLRNISAASATIGVFDGVHIGHQRLIRNTVSCKETTPVLFTFTKSPLSTLRNSGFQEYIMNIDDRLQVVRDIGIEKTVLIDFSLDFSKLSGAAFFLLILEYIGLRDLSIGMNFRCGYRADMGSEEIQTFLESRTVRVHVIDPVLFEGIPVSSTRIRETIRAGDIIRAAGMLGREYSIKLLSTGVRKGLVEVHAEKRHIGQVLPDQGEFDVDIVDGNKKIRTKLHISYDAVSWTQPEQFRTERIHFIT